MTPRSMNATFSTISRWVTDPGGALVERQKLKRWKREHAIKDPAFWDSPEIRIHCLSHPLL